jgi:branched-chain amino acid transport system ATP-binding protein
MTNNTDRTPVLEAKQMCAGYGPVEVVKDLDLVVYPGEVVALLGVNGAGKTTIVRALSGQLKPSGGVVWFKGRPTTAPLHKRVGDGMRLITEDRSVFMGLTTSENIRVAGQSHDACLQLFPELEPLLHRRAGLLSGGEQQMLTLARAMAAEPSILLADELSLGLAPLICIRLLAALRAAADRGSAVLLVEQRVRDALEVADRAYVISNGQVAVAGSASELLGRIEEIESTYLASSELTKQAN